MLSYLFASEESCSCSLIFKGHTVLVDTPGIGHNESLDNILFDFLPEVSSLIFVVDAANAGGTHEDRVIMQL